MLTVVSTANAEGFKTYGERFLASFSNYWPGVDEVRLLFFTEDFALAHSRAEVYDLKEAAPWLDEFKLRNSRNPRATGRGGWKYNAIRFAHKIAAIGAADEMCTSEYLLWLDADIVTHSCVDETAIESWLPGDAWLSWLDRDASIINHPECGFLLFNRRPLQRHAGALGVLLRIYLNDAIFTLPETHDSYVFKHLVNMLDLSVRNLSGDGFRTMHPLINSPLGQWFDHLKGSRKLIGKSHHSDLITSRPEAYWKR